VTVKDIVKELDLKVVTGETFLERQVSGGIVGDLLSVIMAKAKEDNVWVTIQGHVNVVAIAVLTNLACIIVTEGFEIEQEAIEKAKEEEVILLSSTASSYETVKTLSKFGL
jgi:serine kinase of HPr protein (carbohydrate metabolism regulator)